MNQNLSSPQNPSPLNRRRFLAGTGASVLGLTLLQPELVGHTQESSKLNIGLIGAGGRGSWIANLFKENGNYNLVAVADYFQERVDSLGQKFEIPESKRFTGLSGYKRLLEEKLDAVVIESPPYFHPEQAAAAVAAGKHVYLAKPVAVDVPGCLSIEESGRKASAKKLVFLVDFQTRANKLYQDAVNHVRAGDLGKPVIAEANYHCGLMFEKLDAAVRKDPNNPEARLRAWSVNRELSGDVITEQNIHAIDVACWMIDAEPIQAYGTGGRTRDYVGNCWDHFAVTFYFPDDLVLSFNSHQSGFGYDDIMFRMHGLKGTVDTHYFGNVTFKSTEYAASGNVGSLYKDGAVENIKAFYESITKGECGNTTVPASVRSNLTTILGRTAAYKKSLVTWKEVMGGKEKFSPDLRGLKA